MFPGQWIMTETNRVLMIWASYGVVDEFAFCCDLLCLSFILFCINDDVIKWKHFPRYWPFVLGIHRSPLISPHKGQWRGALMFSLICACINGWVNNGEAGDLRCHRAHYDVTVMFAAHNFFHCTVPILLLSQCKLNNCMGNYKTFFHWKTIRVKLSCHLPNCSTRLTSNRELLSELLLAAYAILQPKISSYDQWPRVDRVIVINSPIHQVSQSLWQESIGK